RRSSLLKRTVRARLKFVMKHMKWSTNGSINAAFINFYYLSSDRLTGEQKQSALRFFVFRGGKQKNTGRKCPHPYFAGTAINCYYCCYYYFCFGRFRLFLQFPRRSCGHGFRKWLLRPYVRFLHRNLGRDCWKWLLRPYGLFLLWTFCCSCFCCLPCCIPPRFYYWKEAMCSFIHCIAAYRTSKPLKKNRNNCNNFY